MTRETWIRAIEENITVPPYIAACASACAYDLMHGPAFALIPKAGLESFNDDCLYSMYPDAEDDAEEGDVIEEVYVGQVGNALRAFIDDLPSECWVDTDCDCYMTREPDSHEFIEAEEDDESDDIEEHNGVRGRWQRAWLESVYRLDRSDIVRALFGQTITREFR